MNGKLLISIFLTLLMLCSMIGTASIVRNENEQSYDKENISSSYNAQYASTRYIKDGKILSKVIIGGPEEISLDESNTNFYVELQENDDSVTSNLEYGDGFNPTLTHLIVLCHPDRIKEGAQWHDYNAVWLYYQVTNTGDAYTFEPGVEVLTHIDYIGIYQDESEKLITWIEGGLIPNSPDTSLEFKHGDWVASWFHVVLLDIEDRPSYIRAELSYISPEEFPDSNMDDNDKTSYLPSSIRAKVRVENLTGSPVKNARVTNRYVYGPGEFDWIQKGAVTDEKGESLLDFYPQEPYDVEYTYQIEASKGTESDIKLSELVLEGQEIEMSFELDVACEKSKPVSKQFLLLFKQLPKLFMLLERILKI